MASLAHKLQASFNEQDEATLVRHGMSYGSPSIEQALNELKAEGCDELVVLSLYPQNALSTTGVVADKTLAALSALDWHPQTKPDTRYSQW